MKGKHNPRGKKGFKPKIIEEPQEYECVKCKRFFTEPNFFDFINLECNYCRWREPNYKFYSWKTSAYMWCRFKDHLDIIKNKKEKTNLFI